MQVEHHNVLKLCLVRRVVGILPGFELCLHLVVLVQILEEQECRAADEEDCGEVPHGVEDEHLHLVVVLREHPLQPQDREPAGDPPNIQPGVSDDCLVSYNSEVYEGKRNNSQVVDKRIEREDVGDPLVAQKELEHPVDGDVHD